MFGLLNPDSTQLLYLFTRLRLRYVTAEQARSVTSSVKMAEPELNVDSLISRLLEG